MMKSPRHVYYARYIRLAKQYLRSIGAIEVKFETNGQCFLYWFIDGRRMCISFARGRLPNVNRDYFIAEIRHAFRRNAVRLSA